MNEIRMYLKTSGSIAELYKDFNLFKGSYQNVLLSIYVPKSLLYENQEGTFSNVVKTGAILTSQNGTKITTKSYYADYVKDIEINGIAYSVYSQHLPHEYVVYAGTQTVIANVVALDITDPNTPVVLQITTSQTAQLVIQESAYLADDDIIDPTDLEKINAQLDELQKNKLDKQTGVSSYPQVYAVEGNNQKLIPVSNGSTIAPNDRIAQYTSYGTLFTQPPETDSDTTNKGYVDGEIKKSNDEQMVINERIVEILDGIEIVKVNDLEYNLMVDETIKGTINIPKDQFLKSVSYDPETHVLTFIFLTSDGEVPTPIDMSSLVDVYQAGNGLTLANNTFSIKLDPSSNNALTLSAAGLMLDNTPLEKAAEDIEILNSDIPKSAEETGAFISEDNTLAGAKAEVSVGSKNLFNIAAIPNANTAIDNGGLLSNAIVVEGNIIRNTVSQYNNLWAINVPINVKKGKVTLSATVRTPDENYNQISFDLRGYNSVVPQSVFLDTTGSEWQNIARTFTVPQEGIVYVHIQNIKDGTGANREVEFYNVQLEYGETATAYTPYLSEGTAVEVQACGKNLFDENGVTSTEGATFTELTAEQVKVTATTEIPSGNAGYAGVAQKNIKAGQTVTINASWTTSAPANTGRLAIYWRNANIFIGQQLYSNTPLTVTIPNSTNENDVVYFYFYVATGGGSAAVGDEVTYTNITVNLGEKDLGFSTPVSATYQSAIGETIEVEQYDGITNIISNTAGAAVSTQFLQSTRYELDTKPVSLAGTYAERPTGTYPYVVLYTATDRSGETYRLEANADGSVSANWVKINGMYQHNIVISPDGLTYFSVTLFSVEDYKYSLNNLVKWLDQKGFNANGEDYTNVSGIIKPESEVLIVSHIKVLDGNLTVAASSAVTGNISENTISTVVALNDTVI